MLVQYSIRNNSRNRWITWIWSFASIPYTFNYNCLRSNETHTCTHTHVCFLHMYWWTPILPSRIVRKMNSIKFLCGKYIESNGNNEMRGERKRKQFRFLSFLPFYFYCFVNVCACMGLLATPFNLQPMPVQIQSNSNIKRWIVLTRNTTTAACACYSQHIDLKLTKLQQNAQEQVSFRKTQTILSFIQFCIYTKKTMFETWIIVTKKYLKESMFSANSSGIRKKCRFISILTVLCALNVERVSSHLRVKNYARTTELHKLLMEVHRLHNWNVMSGFGKHWTRWWSLTSIQR